MSAKELSPANSLLIIAASAGLFLATTAIAQFAQALGNQCGADLEEDFGDDENETADLKKLQRWYHSRRVHDRLSYENINDSLQDLKGNGAIQTSEGSRQASICKTMPRHPSENSISPPSSASTSPRASEWDLHRMQNSTRSFARISAVGNRERTILSEMHPNADYDFHPKNRNWRHFEHFNEDDNKRRKQTKFSKDEDFDQHPQSKDVGNGDDVLSTADAHRDDHTVDTDDNEALSISSDGSASSEEQFVWMKHSHRLRTSEDSNRYDEEEIPGVFTHESPSLLNISRDTESRQGRTTGAALETEQSCNSDPGVESIDLLRNNESRLSTNNRKLRKCMSIPSVGSDDYTEPASGRPASYRSQSIPHESSHRSSASSLPLFARALRRMWSSGVASAKSAESSIAEQDPLVGEGTGEQWSGPMDDHRRLRAQYNASIMPEKVILIRHGQSMGNINELLYSTTPDNAMPLTKLGWEQARESGKILKEKILASGESVHFIVSPYVRTVETFHGIASAWCDPSEFNHIKNKEKRIKAWYGRLIQMGLTWNEDSRIREQDFGNYQDPETIKRAKQERHRFGVFYYRFPHGESASDVFDRVSTFLDSLWRSFEMSKSRNYVLVTHGISIRVLLARYFRYTIDQFNILANPRNCEMVVLGHNGDGRLDLQGRCALDVSTNSKTEEGWGSNEDPPGPHVTGYKFHKRLRILPKRAIRKVEIRISADEDLDS